MKERKTFVISFEKHLEKADFKTLKLIINLTEAEMYRRQIALRSEVDERRERKS